MGDTLSVSVSILDKEYEFACAPGEVDALKTSARHVNRQMEAIRSSGRVIGLDRVAIMAALNIANDYLIAQSRCRKTDGRVEGLAEKLQTVLEEHPSAV